MKDKTRGVKSLVEFKKVIVEFGDRINGFVEELSKLLNDIEIPDEEEDTWEMKCPYEEGDEYWLLTHFGGFQKMEWTNNLFDEIVSVQGNTFPTQEAIELELKRRNLLTRFRAFRDECNGDWKADFSNNKEKYYLFYSTMEDCIKVGWIVLGCSFNIFGYFKNREDAEHAIKLFGDEIKALFVDCEG